MELLVGTQLYYNPKNEEGNRKNIRHGLCPLPAFSDSSSSMCHVLEHREENKTS